MDYRERSITIRKQHEINKGWVDKDVFTVGELCSYPDVKPEDGDTWGPWRFQQNNLTLQLEGEYSRFGYELDLEKLESPSEFIGWLTHCLTKIWGTPDVVGNMVVALKDLVFPDWFGNSKLNISKLIVERYGKKMEVRG